MLKNSTWKAIKKKKHDEKKALKEHERKVRRKRMREKSLVDKIG